MSWQIWGMNTCLFCLAFLGPVNTFSSSSVGWRGTTIKEIRLRNQTWRCCCCSLYVCTIITGQQFRKHWQRFRFTSGPIDLVVASAGVYCKVPEFDQTNSNLGNPGPDQMLNLEQTYFVITNSIHIKYFHSELRIQLAIDNWIYSLWRMFAKY